MEMESDDGVCFVCGEIGDLSSKLCYIQLDSDGTESIFHTQTFFSKSYTSIKHALSCFLQPFEDISPSLIVISVSGATGYTDIPLWTCDLACVALNQVGKDLNCDVLLLSYAVGVAWGVPLLTHDDLLCINPRSLINKKLPSNPSDLGILSCLSVSAENHEQTFLTPTGTTMGYQVWATRGELCDFAPSSLVSVKFANYLMMNHYLSRVRVADIFSKLGLVSLFDFFTNQFKKSKKGGFIDDSINIGIRKTADPAQFLLAHRHDKDARYQETIDVFASLLGSEAGNIALKTRSNGGIYISGSTCHLILKECASIFMEGFFSRVRQEDRFKSCLKKELDIPVFCIKPRTDVALLGSKQMARRFLVARGFPYAPDIPSNSHMLNRIPYTDIDHGVLAVNDEADDSDDGNDCNEYIFEQKLEKDNSTFNKLLYISAGLFFGFAAGLMIHKLKS